MDIRAAEISRVIRDQIANFDSDAEISEVGTALSVGHITVNLSSGTNTVSIPLTK